MILRQPQKTIKMETFGLWRREDHLFDYGQSHRTKEGPVAVSLAIHCGQANIHSWEKQF